LDSVLSVLENNRTSKIVRKARDTGFKRIAIHPKYTYRQYILEFNNTRGGDEVEVSTLPWR
jgi:hypothetical protein